MQILLYFYIFVKRYFFQFSPVYNIYNNKRIDTEKKELDLSEDQYKKTVKLNLELSQVDSIDKLPYEFMREEYKSYEAWRDSRMKIFKPVEENGKYYYYMNTHQIEYLIDITLTNKLGVELKNKYILAVERDGWKWSVIKFEER